MNLKSDIMGKGSMKSWLKTELHTHTIDDPQDGKRPVCHSAQQLIDEAEKQGFQVLSITNHNQLLFSPSLAARGRSTFSELRWYPPMEAAKGSLSWVFRAKQPESVRTGP